MLIPIRYNLRYLWRRRGGTLMTALTFAMVVAVFVLVTSLATGLETAFRKTGHPLTLLFLRPGVTSEMQSAVSIERYQTIRELRGIARDEAGLPLAAPEVLVIVNKPKRADLKTTNLQIRGVHPQGIKLRPEVRIVEGRMFRPGLRELIVSRSVASRFAELGLGDTPRLGKGTWTVTGLFEAAGSAYESEVWADYRELMEEFDRDAYSTVLARAIDSAAADSLVRAVEEDVRLKLNAQSETDYYEEQTRSAGGIKALGQFLAAVMSIGACFAGMNSMYGAVAGRVREIGTLRVLGFTPASILWCFLAESILMALVGGALGCLISLPMNGVATGTTNFLSFSEVLFRFRITPGLLATGMAFAVAMGLAGGFLPAANAARKTILQTLRQA